MVSYGTVICITQPPTKESASSALFSNLSKVWLGQLCRKALQAPSFGGGFVIPITVPYRVIESHQALF